MKDIEKGRYCINCKHLENYEYPKCELNENRIVLPEKTYCYQGFEKKKEVCNE